MKNIMTLMIFIACTLILSTSAKAQAVKADDVIGKWLNEEQDAKIDVTKVNGKFFGKIVWLKEPNEEWGTPKVDDENPDESLRNRPVMGLEILKDFVFDEDEWNDGTIYDPKNGNTYKCYMELESPSTLKIRGYIGKAWMGLGRTTYWTKAE